jgi:hypothetical protein
VLLEDPRRLGEQLVGTGQAGAAVDPASSTKAWA